MSHRCHVDPLHHDIAVRCVEPIGWHLCQPCADRWDAEYDKLLVSRMSKLERAVRSLGSKILKAVRIHD